MALLSGTLFAFGAMRVPQAPETSVFAGKDSAYHPDASWHNVVAGVNECRYGQPRRRIDSEHNDRDTAEAGERRWPSGNLVT
jgi:hypothetical protein